MTDGQFFYSVADEQPVCGRRAVLLTHRDVTEEPPLRVFVLPKKLNLSVIFGPVQRFFGFFDAILSTPSIKETVVKTIE